MFVSFFALSCAAWLGVAAQQPAPAPLPVPQLPPQTFVEWLSALRSEAVARGITEATLDRALTGLEPLPIVLERDRSQAELVLTLDEYLQRRLTRPMVKTARKMGAQHRALLRKVSAKYGVPSGIIVAIWGLESNYGRFSGVRPTIATLATLAYDPRRSTMFREELFNALKILDSGDVEPAALRGSWAGALGQPQFMPSSFLEFAQDFDGDGRRDIWKSTADVFASIANYLSAHGWTRGRTWGREVKVPVAIADAVAEAAPLQETGCLAERQMSVALPLSKWRTLGVRTLTGAKLPVADLQASLIAAGPRRFLVYPNYQALLAYNCAHAYGLSVALLADRVH
jgi:membrane-bound lytic murein transglycosylase B